MKLRLIYEVRVHGAGDLWKEIKEEGCYDSLEEFLQERLEDGEFGRLNEDITYEYGLLDPIEVLSSQMIVEPKKKAFDSFKEACVKAGTTPNEISERLKKSFPDGGAKK
jgi:hypothetical protein